MNVAILFANDAWRAGEDVVDILCAAISVPAVLLEINPGGIGARRSPFEQFHALVLAEKLPPLLDPTANEKLRAVIQAQIGNTITKSDSSRWVPAHRILAALDRLQLRKNWTVDPQLIEVTVAGSVHLCVEVRPPSSFVQFTDVEEWHGKWVQTRGTHSLQLPQSYRLGRNLVTNAEFSSFVRAGGYECTEFWLKGAHDLGRLLTADRSTRGPAGWPAANRLPEGKGRHPVAGICFWEALAFIEWLNREAPQAGWRWVVPTEDMWEYAARTEAGLTYPWGDAFDPQMCNSREAGVGGTSDVDNFVSGASREGCRDMAGNTWEFVSAVDCDFNSCVLRGGSYKNDRFQIRSYLRLFGVPPTHRPPDFGFRVAQQTNLSE